MPTLDVTKNWVAGLATIPLYLAIAIVLNRFSPIGWLFAIVVAMFLVSALYRTVVIRLVSYRINPLSAIFVWLIVQSIIIGTLVICIRVGSLE